jgi:cytochrome c nitrite reductase small subunit
MLPPKTWQIPVILLLGGLVGIGATAFKVSNASSYLSDDPRACVNCHVMTPQYATWEHSSHRERASCNDCHVPHDNVFNKYYFKAKDGARHATIFTLRTDPQVIRIKEAGKGVVQQNCIRCHTNQVNPVSASNVTGHNYKLGEGPLCWDCHVEVPHGKISSQASTPNARVPALEPVVPEWLEKFVNKSSNK